MAKKNIIGKTMRREYKRMVKSGELKGNERANFRHHLDQREAREIFQFKTRKAR